MEQHRGRMAAEYERAVDTRAEGEPSTLERSATGQPHRRRPVQRRLPPLRRLTNPPGGLRMRGLRRSLVVAAVGTTALLLVACGGSSSTSSSVKISASNASSGKVCPYRFAVITHGDNGSFWSVVYKGAKNAASDFGCTLTSVYGSQQQGQAQPDDNAENAQIQNAI